MPNLRNIGCFPQVYFGVVLFVVVLVVLVLVVAAAAVFLLNQQTLFSRSFLLVHLYGAEGLRMKSETKNLKAVLTVLGRRLGLEGT